MLAIIVPIAVILVIIGIFLVFSKSSSYRENINIREERSWIPSNIFETSESPSYIIINAPNNHPIRRKRSRRLSNGGGYNKKQRNKNKKQRNKNKK